MYSEKLDVILPAKKIINDVLPSKSTRKNLRGFLLFPSGSHFSTLLFHIIIITLLFFFFGKLLCTQQTVELIEAERGRREPQQHDRQVLPKIDLPQSVSFIDFCYIKYNTIVYVSQRTWAWVYCEWVVEQEYIKALEIWLFSYGHLNEYNLITFIVNFYHSNCASSD